MSTCNTIEKYCLGDKVDFYIWATTPDNLIDNDFVLSVVSPFGVGIEFQKVDLTLEDDMYLVEILPETTKIMRTGTYRVEVRVNGEITGKFENCFELVDSYSKKFA